jgi:RHS repeat-associated protein
VIFLVPLGIGLRTADAPSSLTGQSATLLSDGRWLLLGGEGPQGVTGAAVLWDARTGVGRPLSASLQHPRAWHTATVMPDGSILVLGGLGPAGAVVEEAERFLPASEAFEAAGSAPQARASHTATLLTDGRLLLAGGLTPGGAASTDAELWDPDAQVGVSLPTVAGGRLRHTATLLPTGGVLLAGGIDAHGSVVTVDELFAPETLTIAPVVGSAPDTELSQPQLIASIPGDSAIGVPVEIRIALRFSRPLRLDTLHAQTVILSGPRGIESATVVPAEAGRLTFVSPEAALQPGATYALALNGPVDDLGQALPYTEIRFTTAVPGGGPPMGGKPGQPERPEGEEGTQPKEDRGDRAGDPGRDDEADEDPASRSGVRRDEGDQPPMARPGVTALAGRVRTLDGQPLRHVMLRVGSRVTRTDKHGWFLLQHLRSGHNELLIDGRKTGRGGRHYGVFEVGVVLNPGQTLVLPYTIWMPELDTANAIQIPSPTTEEVVLTTPRIPGLEIRIPPGTVISDHEHRVAREITITPIPVERPPFPLPAVPVPAYFTIQPGGGYVYNQSGAGVRIIYPNRLEWPVDTRVSFWSYDPGGVGWDVYGHGNVTPDGKQAVPEPSIGVYEFTGAMAVSGPPPPPAGPPPGNSGGDDGDPVDLATGLLVHAKTDLVLGDLVPMMLTRTYRPLDSYTRPFGRGASHPFAIFVRAVTETCQEANLILPHGGRIRYVRTNPGTVCTGATFEHAETPTEFFKSRLEYVLPPGGAGARWVLTRRDGMVYHFNITYGVIEYVQDRFGNSITLSDRAVPGDATPKRIISSAGRWLSLTYDGFARITQVQDNLGRTVSYTYDPGSGALATVTDAAGGVTEYTYDASGRMRTTKDARGIIWMTNDYDSAGRVIRQTQADGTSYEFAYTLDAQGKITQVDVTDPRGYVRRVTLNTKGYVLTDTRALGQPIQQTTTYERNAATNQITAVVDPLGRRTEFTYDSQGNRTSVTRLAGTPDAVTTGYTYDGTFSQVTSITDPLNHTTTFGYDGQGRLTSITNPLNHQTVITPNAAGQPLSVRDPLNNTTVMTYEAGDLVTIADPLGNTTRRFVDGGGRLFAETDPLGRTIRYEYDSLNRLTRITDARGGVTAFTYDPNGNLLTVTDTRNNSTSYAYDSMDRPITRTDPLTRQESYQYDNNGNMTQFTDRKSQVTTYTYDALNRRTLTVYADSSTTTCTYDAGDRVTSLADSIAGTIGRTYDGLDRLTQETTPEGTIGYTYDGAGRRTSMTVAGQPAVTYSYDSADRVTGITQQSSTVGVGYDAASRRTSLTLPNGIVIDNSYDIASRLAGLTYKLGITTLGTLSYAYDAAGERMQMGGTWARTGMPQAVAAASYNANNQQVTFGSATMTFDLNGNLATQTDGSGTTAYTWNARNQLTVLSGSGLAATFGYDGLGRRRTKTINGVRTDFLYDGAHPVQEGVLPATPATNLLTGLGIDEYLTRSDAGGARHLLPDALGSTLALTDGLGAVSTEYTYEPFGVTSPGGASSANVYQFTGRENDGTGVYYYRARFYHPGLGRFIGEDPAGFAGGDVNLYAYVRNNPVNWSDPFGLSRDSYQLDRYKHGADRHGPHVDRYNPAGQNVGRYRPDMTPIPTGGKVPPPIPRSDWPKFIKEIRKLGPKALGIAGLILGELMEPRDAGAGSDVPGMPWPPTIGCRKGCAY